MHQPALPWPMRFENIRVCQYCDKEIHGEPVISSATGRPEPLCSHNCKTLYDKAAIKQTTMGWDVT